MNTTTKEQLALGVKKKTATVRAVAVLRLHYIILN